MLRQIILAVVLFVAVSASGRLAAAVLTVTNSGDAGAGTLRQSIAAAIPGDTIDFSIDGTLSLTSGQLVIDKDLTLRGPGADVLTISGDGQSRVFSVLPGVNVLISGLTIAHGEVSGAEAGAGIRNQGHLTLSDCAVSLNKAIGSEVANAQGGGIMNELAGVLNLVRCTLNHNEAFSGGGLYNFGTMTLTNCTVSGNRALLGGGGIENWGSLMLSFSTVANNLGDGLRIGGGSASYENSLFAGNGPAQFGLALPSFGQGPLALIAGSDIAGSGMSLGHNLTSDGSGNLTGPGDLPAGNAMLGSLTANGGTTFTHALLPASPAINAGANANAPATDQRGLPRITGGTADIGAFELQAIALVIGGQLYATGDPITVEVLPPTAEFTSELRLFSPGPNDAPIALSHQTGLIVDVGSYPAGTELVFGLFVINVEAAYRLGLGHRNPDGIPHAAVDFEAPGLAIVGFEDLFGGGDFDFDDARFKFTGGIAPLGCPSNIVRQADPGECTAAVEYSVGTPDGVGGTLMCVPPAGAAFAAGTTTVQCTATYSNGPMVTCSFDVTVAAGPPQLACRPDRVVACGASWDFDPPMVIDSCGATNVTVRIVSTVTNAMCGSTFSATRIWEALDAQQNSAACTQTVAVVDTIAPSITCAGHKTVECGITWSFDAPAASDGCGAVMVSIVSTATNAGAGCGSTFSVTRTWRANDACGNSEQCSQTVTVLDRTPPVLVGIPPHRMFNCLNDVPPPAVVTAIDNCHGPIAVTILSSTNGGCPMGVVHRWTATDPCGNIAQGFQTNLITPIAPVVVRGLSDAASCLGREAFFCLAVASACAVEYQWFKDGLWLTGQTNSCLSLAQLTTAHAGVYCVVAGSDCRRVTNCATLTIVGNTGATALTNETVCAGRSAAFCTTATGLGPFQYEWSKDGAVLPGETNACLTVEPVEASDAGGYCVRVTGACGTATQCATLTVGARPGIPRLRSARIASDPMCDLHGILVVFSAETQLSGLGDADNYAIPGVSILSAQPITAPSNSVLLRTTPMQCESSYLLTIRSIRDLRGASLCPDPLTVPLTPLDVPCCNRDYTLDLPAGYSLLANQLNRGGNRLGEVLPVVPERTRVSVPDAEGSFETHSYAGGVWSGNPVLKPGGGFFMFLPEPASLMFMGSQPRPALPLSLGDGPNLVSRQLPERSRYEDMVGLRPAEGTVLRRHLRGSSGMDLPSYYQTHIYRDGMWSGGDPLALLSEAVIIQSFSPVAITRQPVSPLDVFVGGAVEFSVEATGSGPLLYQWQRNGVNIPGATGTVFTLPMLSVGDGGAYSVTVANSVGAVRSETALLRLRLPTLPLTNDYGARVTVTDTEGAGRNNNLEATPEQGEFNHAGKPVGKSMWMDWTPSVSGVATFSTAGSSFDTVLAVYTGALLSGLVEVHSDDDSGPDLTSVIRFQAMPGVLYHIVVDGYASDSGEVVLSWDVEPRADVLPGIVSQPRSVVTGLGSNVTFTVVASGSGLSYQWFFQGQPLPGETLPTLTVPNAQAANAGEYFVRIQQGPQFLDSRMAVLEFSRVGPLNEVQNIFSADKFSDLSIESGDPGLARTDATAAAQAAAFVRGFTGTQIFSTFGSINQPSEPLHCGVAGVASRWFAYVAPADGTLALNTEGSDFDTVLAVYTGTGFSLSNLTPLACDRNNGSNGLTSKLTLPATLNTVYYVAVDGENGARGTVNLNYACLVPVWLLNMEVTPSSTSFKVVSTPGFPFAIERSSNYLNWVSLFVTNSPSGTNSFTDSSPPPARGRFYRVTQTP